MNFEQLRIFIEVAEQKSFTKAAEALYISHSTTSRNVASLEENVGVQLLNRDNRSVKLTPAGEILYREGARLVKKIEAIESAVKSAGLGLRGKITLFSVNLYSYELFNGYKDFCRKYPDVMLGIYHRDIPEIWTQVSNGDADIGVTFSYVLPEDMKNYEICKVATERFCLIAPVGHPLAKQKTVKLDELRKTSYISMPPENFDYLKRLDDQSRYPLFERETSAVPTLESLFLQVRSGNGVSLVPYPIAYEYGANCAVLDVEDADTSFDVVMFWRKDNQNPSMTLFTEAMKPHLDRD